MTKAKISEYDAVAANNTDVNGVNIAENCPPSGMNNMGREIMAALKRFQTGSDSDGVTVGGNLVVSGSSTLSTTSISSADINAGTIDGTAIGGSTPAAGSFTTLNTSGAVVFNDAGADVDFRVEGDTDANLLFVDAGNDRVGIGVSTPQNKFQIDDGGVSATGVLRLNNPANAGDNFGVQLLFSNVGSGPTYHSMASITAIRTNAAANYNSDLLFATQASSGASLTERMRITSGGEVYIAGTTDQGLYNLQCNGTGVWGAGAYVNGSDARIKDDIAPIESGLDVVEKLNPVTYRYNEEWSKDQSTQTGFIAQELLVALEGKNYVDGVVQQGGSEGYYSVAYQSIIPILTKAIQELSAKNNALEARIAALEGQ
jgi:hypothetical protein